MAIIKDLGYKGKCHVIVNSTADYLNKTQDVYVRHYFSEEDYNAEEAERAEIAAEIRQAEENYNEMLEKFEQGEATEEEVAQALHNLQIASSKTAQDKHIPGMADDKYAFTLTEDLDVSEALETLLKATPEYAEDEEN